MPWKRPYRKRRAVKKGKTRAPRKRFFRSKANGVPDKAGCTVMQPFAPPPPANPLLNQGTAYKSYNVTLAQCPRAAAIAQQYQYYRIKRVTLTFKPLRDTFITAGNNSVPYLYFMIDRMAQFGNVATAQQFKELGAKPIRFDEKTIRISYVPNVAGSVLDNQPAFTTVFAKIHKSPWLPCNQENFLASGYRASEIDHLGIVWMVENPGGDPIQYLMDRQIEFEFKKPALLMPPSQESAVDWDEVIESATETV